MVEIMCVPFCAISIAMHMNKVFNLTIVGSFYQVFFLFFSLNFCCCYFFLSRASLITFAHLMNYHWMLLTIRICKIV